MTTRRDFISKLEELVSELKYIQLNCTTEFIEGNNSPIYDTVSSIENNLERLQKLLNITE